MKITEVIITVRIPNDKTKNDLAQMINKREILDWVPRDSLKCQGIDEGGNAPDEKVVHVRFQELY